MIKKNYKHISYFEEVELLQNKKVIFTDLRVDKDTLPENLYAYDIRHWDEDWSLPVTIEKNVCVNYFGCIITNEPIDFGEQGYINIEYEDFSYTGEVISSDKFEEYFNN